METSYVMYDCRDTFPVLEQFNIIMRFIIDQSQTPNVKVKAAILNYITALSAYMSASEFVNNSDTRLAVSRIITWTTEPKSTEVRKVLCTLQIMYATYLSVTSAVIVYACLFSGSAVCSYRAFQPQRARVFYAAHRTAKDVSGSNLATPMLILTPALGLTPTLTLMLFHVDVYIGWCHEDPSLSRACRRVWWVRCIRAADTMQSNRPEQC